MAYMILFYLLVFSLIAHKEKRFMLAITAFTYLTLGYLLVRKVKIWKSWVGVIVWTGVLVEFAIQAFYHIHHKLWVFSDYMLAQGQAVGDADYHPHSFYTSKRYDQPWHSNLHHPDPAKRTKVYVARSEPDFFLKKHHTNLVMAYDMSNLMCVDLLDKIHAE